MEASQLLREQLIRCLYHQERVKVLLLVVKGREGFDRSLMVALWVCAPEVVCYSNGVLTVYASLG